MDEARRAFRGTANRIGGTLLFFTFLFWLFQLVLYLTGRLTKNADPTTADVIYQLVTAIGYAAAFIIPVLFFRLLSINSHYEPIRARFTLPRRLWAFMLVALSINLVFAVFNSYLVEPFHYSAFMEAAESAPVANYQIALALLTTAVVPAFVEELLFRGVILNNLLPYGRDTAILLSALCFGLMHQNAGQFLYTTVAGIALGYVFVAGGNIWAGVLIHFVNNGMSVLWEAVEARTPSRISNPVIYAVETALLLAGVGAFVYLLTRRDRPDLAAEPIEELPGTPIPVRERMRLFVTSPTMIIFMVVSGLEMLVYLFLSLIFAVL